MYATESAVGYLGLLIVSLALGGIAWWLVYRILQAEGVAEFPAWLLSLSPLLFGAMYWRARPAMFTVLLTAFFLHELYASRRGERRSLWHLAPLLVLWANLHAGYVIGLGLLGIFALATLIETPTRRRPEMSFAHVLKVTAVGVAVTSLTPYTYEGWLYPLSYLSTGNANLMIIDEWRSPDFHEIRNLPFALLLIGLVLVGTAPRRDNLWNVLLTISFSVLALQAVRHQVLFGLAAPIALGVALSERWSWWTRPRPGLDLPRAINLVGLMGVMAAFVALIAASPAGLPLWSPPIEEGSLGFPRRAVLFMKENEIRGRVFNDYAWGGYLIDKRYPDNLVFIDGRADPYGELLSEYPRIASGAAWEPAFDKYNVELALIRVDTRLALELQGAGWDILYQDDLAILLRAPQPLAFAEHLASDSTRRT